jgi:prevent-host-death family protein
MARVISQRELRNNSGDIMRELDSGETFIVTRNGVPVGQLTPLMPRTFVATDKVLAMFAGGAPIDAEEFRTDIDAFVDQDPTPRG